MASNINVDEIEPVNPLLPVNFKGTSIPTYNGSELMTAFPPTPSGAAQTAVKITAGTGVPNNAHGEDGYIYFRSDGVSGSTVYLKVTGVWVGVA